MDLRGQRFVVDLSDDEEESASTSRLPPRAAPSITSAFIGDIKERTTAPPSAPKLKTTPTGFPEHKKRTRISAFKQQRAAATKSATADMPNAFGGPPPPAARASARGAPPHDDTDFEQTERRRIDEENNQRLAAMSAEEIEEERNELLAALDPSLIEKLLRRANLDQDRGDTGIDPQPASGVEGKESQDTSSREMEGVSAPRSAGKATKSPKSVTFDKDTTAATAVPAPRPAGKSIIPRSVNFEDDKEPTDPIDLQPASDPFSQAASISQPEIHFPSAPSAPELNPSDPSFLESLHKKYFPTLPADPSKLAWMAPIPTHGSIADQESPYYPAHEALPASALRFDFRGGILPPRIARAMPMTKGLHHHGEAPEAAGYTVPELARLARSSFPAQRCIAFQTLGRLLYRLGRGEWGDADGEITKGLWRCVEEGKVIQTLEEAANADSGHQGSKVYAIEAVWLWQKGGGKLWKAS